MTYSSCAFGGEEVDVFPVRGVQGHGGDFDEHVVVAELGQGRVGLSSALPAETSLTTFMVLGVAILAVVGEGL